MEIKINGTVTINTAEDAQNGSRTIDNTFLSNETTFTELLRALCNSPEVTAAAKAEVEDRAEEEKEVKLRKAYGDDYDLVFDKKELQKAKRRPGAMQLRENFPCIAKTKIGSNGLCEVYSNGYAIYDNGDRRTVLWVPDCRTTTYYFGKLRDNEKEYLSEIEEIGEEVLGACPWYIALMLAGENSIERNMDHPKSVGTTSDTDKEAYEVERSLRWIGSCHFDTPEEAYLKKEAAEECRNALTEKQREVYVMYYEEGLNQYEIANRIGSTQQNVSKLLTVALDKIKKIF